MAQVTDIESDFFMPWFSEDAQTRGTQFEHLMCYWLLVDPLRKDEYDLVTVVRYEDWPGRSGPDLGVDLVGTDSQGRLWAVQCKAYALDTTISKDEVSILVGASPAAKFFGRIYITTSNSFTDNAKTIAKDNAVLLISRSTLDSSTVVWPESGKDLHLLLGGEAVVKPKSSPRGHQQDAVDAVVDAFKYHDRGKLLMACGTGKTLTSLWIQERVLGPDTAQQGPRRTVVLFPSISLLSQTLHEWTSQRSHTWRRLAVCSDQSVMSSRKNDTEDYSDVLVGDLDFSVTTDQSVIEEFLRSDDDQVIFATYQSSKQVGQAALNCGVEYDLVICDEAHHLTGSLDKTNSSVLTNEKFPTKKRLFMTATPRIITPLAVSEATDAGYKVSSMDDEKLFGVIAYELNFGKAIADEVLTDYQVVVAVTSAQSAKDLNVDKFIDIDNTKTTTQDLASTIASAKALEKYDVSRSISFHSTISRSKSFVHILKTLSTESIDGVPTDLHADHVDGTMPSSERLKKLHTLKKGSSSHSLLANARCLSEGVDVPALDGVIFVDPRQSEIDIVQAVGRAIRKSADKKVGTVVIPIVYSVGSDGAGQLDAKGHKKLRQVLWSLRAHDAALGVEIDELVYSQKLSNHGVARLPSKIIIEIGEEYTGEELRKFASGISVTVLKAGSPDADWSERYNEVVEYYKKNKSWPSAKDSDPEVKSLGKWVGTQRGQGKRLASGVKSHMTQERYDRLDRTPGWLWDSLSDVWESNFAGCLEYYRKNKSWPNAKDSAPEVKPLGKWVGHQRTNGKKLAAGATSPMTQERYDKLDKTPGWLWDSLSDVWESNFAGCLEYYKKNNSWPNAKDSDPEVKPLGKWVGHQRTNGKKLASGATSPMTQERYDKLDKTPGWVWDARALKK
jgi:predicted helicase